MVTVAEEVWECARKVTIISFSIFMSMFHQRFTEHRFLESTLELLQQFYLQVESIAHDYKVFPGDQSKFSLKCLCCGKKFTPTELLWKLLFMAPMAFCHYLKILSSIPLVNDSPLIFKNMPVLFTSTKKNHQKVCFTKLFMKQAKRGFAKEASVYFLYLDSVLFCTVHYATLPFRHSAIPPFRHSTIPPFRHSVIPSFRHSAIPPFCHSAILPFHHSAPLRNNPMYVSQEVLRKAVKLPGGLRSNRYVPPLQAK